MRTENTENVTPPSPVAGRAGSPGKGRFRLWLVYYSLVLSASVLLFSGLVSEWGRWYSPSVPLRQQTEALLNGRLALSDSVADVEHDMVWDNGRVQQVWGLGVPLWRLPFEGVAKLTGFRGFPDRLAFGIALALTAYLVLAVFLRPQCSGDSTSWTIHLKRHPEKVCAIFLLLLFPPFLRVTQKVFLVYEEVQAYAFLAGVGLLAGTLYFVRYPTWRMYLILGFLAGLPAFIRPTAGVFGLASMCIIFIQAHKLGWSRWRQGVGLALFTAGGALLFVSNIHRFGSGTEFGHSLNLNHVDQMRFASRFDAPYQEETLFAAATELVSTLFFLNQQVEIGHAANQPFGRSETFRWRPHGFPTYSPSYLCLLLVLGGWLGRRCWRRWRSDTVGPLSEPEWLALWCFLCTAPLLIFYLRFPFINPRYLLDFAPGFAAGLLAVVHVVSGTVAGRRGLVVWPRYFVTGAVFLWWSYHLHSTTYTGGWAPLYQPATTEETLSRLELNRPAIEAIPKAYFLGASHPGSHGLFNGAGWDAMSGITGAAVILFVEGPDYLELKLKPARDIDLILKDYLIIQAKVGLEFLELESIRKEEEGAIVRFRGPRRSRYQSGVQVAFVGFVTAEELSRDPSRFRLLSVHWRDLNESEEGREPF